MRVASLSLLGLCVLSAGAWADSPWGLNVGITEVVPNSSTGTLNNTYSSKVTNAMSLTPAIEYTFAPHWVGELLLATPLSHEVKLTGGGLNNAKEVKFSELPPTLFIKYNVLPGEAFQPYVGVGLNYTLVWGVKAENDIAGTSVKAGNSLGLAGSAGLEWRPQGSAWGAGVDLRYIDLKSDVKVNGSKVGTLNINPWVYTVGATYHF